MNLSTAQGQLAKDLQKTDVSYLTSNSIRDLRSLFYRDLKNAFVDANPSLNVDAIHFQYCTNYESEMTAE
ncbi:MAG: hypothetical protein K2L48_01685 [Mycoplasmoidaceae bacterium]|nr:hypothetical protein [Mycoplasmoidaceae bacterium]